jgi:hypothetical protein
LSRYLFVCISLRFSTYPHGGYLRRSIINIFYPRITPDENGREALNEASALVSLSPQQNPNHANSDCISHTEIYAGGPATVSMAAIFPRGVYHFNQSSQLVTRRGDAPMLSAFENPDVLLSTDIFRASSRVLY